MVHFDPSIFRERVTIRAQLTCTSSCSSQGQAPWLVCMCVCVCVESLPSSFLSPLSFPTIFVLELSKFNKNQYTWLPFHFCFCSCVHVGGWGTRGLEKERAEMSPWITCSGDRKPPSSTHHLARSYIPSPPRVCFPSEGEGISRLKEPIQKSGYFAKPENPASGCGSC